MLRRKTRSFSACLVCLLLAGIPASRMQAQKPAPAPAPVPFVSPATLNRLFSEAEAAFAAKEYDKAVAKIQELLKDLGPNKDAPLELLYFNIGLGYLLGGKAPEAEEAFTECLKRFPQGKGEFASRCYLGVGRACILQDTPEKKERAIEALKLAALDPRYRSEAGLGLGQVLLDLHKRDEAMVVFKSLMGSDIRSPAQTTAAVEVIGLLADTGKLEDLIAYLDRLINQSGVRDAIAWYTNQVIVHGDELVKTEAYDAALAIYRSIPTRGQILETQKVALESQRKDVKTLEARVAVEQNLPINKRSSASDYLNNLKPAVDLAEKALAAIEEKKDLDAALLMRRGRCLYYLKRYEEALLCFRTLRLKHGTAEDAQHAAYAEIVIMSELKDTAQIKVLCDAYLRKYPAADNTEQVATLAGELLVQSGKWADVGKFYRDLEEKFPKSANMDRYTYYQAVSFFYDANFKESGPIFAKFLKNYPSSPLIEKGYYFVAMSNFLQGVNRYKETLASIKEYLSRYPEGNFAGDMRYRLAFIDYNDTDEDQTDKIIRDLTSFLIQHPQDQSVGSMYCLLADTYKKKKSQLPDELARFQSLAIENYKKAVWSESPEDVVQYALEAATSMMQENKDWTGIAALHSEFLEKKPNSSLVLNSITWIVKTKAREGKVDEAAEMVANALKPRIGNPASEQVELLIDELVKTLVPRKKAKDVDIDALDKQLIAILNKAIGTQQNATTNARLYYARARLAQLLKRTEISDQYLKGVATINAKDPSVLSPALLAVSGDILLKDGKLEDAEAMYRRLSDRFTDGNYADAGPMGLGYIALARNKPAEALRIFEESLDKNPGMSRFKETTIGKLQAIIEIGDPKALQEAEKFAKETVGDKSFRGEYAGKLYLLLGKIYRKQSEKADGPDAKIELLKQAYANYQHVYIAYKSTPEICAEAYWQAYETATEMGNKTYADENLQALLADPKLKNTERYKKASAGAPDSK